MPGIAIFAVAILVGFITGVFKRVQHQRTTIGVVVSIEHIHDTDESIPTYYACAEYKVNEKIYSVRSQYKSASYRPGQKVRIAYNARNPKQAFFKPSFANYLIVSLLVVVSIIVMIQTL